MLTSQMTSWWTTFRTADGASLAVESCWVELCCCKWGFM